jgi:hypothetical protein
VTEWRGAGSGKVFSLPVGEGGRQSDAR